VKTIRLRSILRKRAASELDGGFRAHHNALIYAANELENARIWAGGRS
jgi:hypothetical protein